MVQNAVQDPSHVKSKAPVSSQLTYSRSAAKTSRAISDHTLNQSKSCKIAGVRSISASRLTSNNPQVIDSTTVPTWETITAPQTASFRYRPTWRSSEMLYIDFNHMAQLQEHRAEVRNGDYIQSLISPWRFGNSQMVSSTQSNNGRPITHTQHQAQQPMGRHCLYCTNSSSACVGMHYEHGIDVSASRSHLSTTAADYAASPNVRSNPNSNHLQPVIDSASRCQQMTFDSDTGLFWTAQPTFTGVLYTPRLGPSVQSMQSPHVAIRTWQQQPTSSPILPYPPRRAVFSSKERLPRDVPTQFPRTNSHSRSVSTECSTRTDRTLPESTKNSIATAFAEGFGSQSESSICEIRSRYIDGSLRR